MSRCFKKHPAGKNNTGSQRKGKTLSHRLFRKRERMALRTGIERDLPFRQWLMVDQWDLTDGRMYFGDWPKDEWYARLMRK